MNLCCSNHSFRTHRMDLGLHSWKESSHFEVLPLGCLRSPDLKALEISLKKKKKSQDFPKEDSHHPLQLEQPGQAAISGSPGFNCLGLGIQIAASCSGLLSFACLARRVNAKPYFSGAVSQSMKSSCLKACLEGFCSRCGLALPLCSKFVRHEPAPKQMLAVSI